MNKTEITYRNLKKVPNEIILAVYNCILPYAEVNGAIDFRTDEYKAIKFMKIIAPYTQESVAKLKEKYAQELKISLEHFLQSCNGDIDVDEIHNTEKELYTEYRDKVRALDEIVNLSRSFYHKLEALYDNGIVSDFENKKPFEMPKPNTNMDRFLVVNGNLIYINERERGKKSGFLYTEYKFKEAIDELIDKMYKENGIQSENTTETPAEN